MGKKERLRFQKFLDSNPDPETFADWVLSHQLKASDILLVEQYLEEHSDSDIGIKLLGPLLQIVPHSNPCIDLIARDCSPKPLSLELKAQFSKLIPDLRSHFTPIDRGLNPSDNIYLSRVVVLLTLSDDILQTITDEEADEYFPSQDALFTICMLPHYIIKSPGINVFIDGLLKRLLRLCLENFQLTSSGDQDRRIYLINQMARLTNALFVHIDLEPDTVTIGLHSSEILSRKTKDEIIQAHKEAELTDRFYSVRREALRVLVSLLHIDGLSPHQIAQFIPSFKTTPSVITRCKNYNLGIGLLSHILVFSGLDPIIPTGLAGVLISPLSYFNIFPFHAAITDQVDIVSASPVIVDSIVGLGILCFHSGNPLYPLLSDSKMAGISQYIGKSGTAVFNPYPTTKFPTAAIDRVYSAYSTLITSSYLSMPLCVWRQIYIFQLLRGAMHKVSMFNQDVGHLNLIGAMDFLQRDIAWAARSLDAVQAEQRKQLDSPESVGDPTIDFGGPPPIFYHHPSVMKSYKHSGGTCGNKYDIEWEMHLFPITLSCAWPYIFQALYSKGDPQFTMENNGQQVALATMNEAEGEGLNLAYVHKALNFLYFLTLLSKDAYARLGVRALVKKSCMMDFFRVIPKALYSVNRDGNAMEKQAVMLVEDVFSLVTAKIKERDTEQLVIDPPPSGARDSFKQMATSMMAEAAMFMDNI